MNRVTQILLKCHLSRPRPGTAWTRAAQPSQANAGVTLLEALVAMMLITITVSVITPPIFLATATRVSNQRTEQAMQLAQGEIERVRLLMLGSEPYATINPQLPPIAATPIKKNTVEQVGAPTSLCTPPGAGGPVPTVAPCTPLQLVATANDNLYIQTFREDGATAPSGEVVAFRMGVRIYGAEALDANGQPAAGLLAEPSNIKFTTGTGNRGNRPLVAFYTEMIRGTEGNALSSMRDPVNWD